MSNLSISMKPLQDFLLYCILFYIKKGLLVGFVSLWKYIISVSVNKVL